MPKYNASIAYNVPCYATIEFEAKNDKAAIEYAKEAARNCEGDYEPAYDVAEDHRVVDVKRGAIDDESDDVIAEDIEV